MITWVTASSLGTIFETTYTDIAISATSDVGIISYQVINGVLPYGISLSSLGHLTGYAGSIQDSPTYSFTVRANERDGIGNLLSISDKTFSLTLNSQHLPVLSPAAGSIGVAYTGASFSFQFAATDPNPDRTLTFHQSSGTLPPGLSLSSLGLLSGVIPVTSIASGTNRAYNFSIAVNDTVSQATAAYSLTVLNRAANTSDNVANRASIAIISADASTRVVPVILNTDRDLGIHRADDQYSYQVVGFNFNDRTALTYSIASGSLPPTLTLNPTTGWIKGYLQPQVPPRRNVYDFSVIATVSGTAIASQPKPFTITIDSLGSANAGALDNWAVDSDLGILRLGDVSTLTVAPDNTSYTFRLAAGSSLPPNLSLLNNGLIVGRVSFNGVMTGTQDVVYPFTVDMYDSLGTVVAERVFTVTIQYQAPYETLYLQVFPKATARTRFYDIIHNTTTVPRSSVYRYEDSYFGLTKQFKMLALTGLTPTAAAQYIATLSKNHRRRTSYVESIAWTTAKNRVGKTIYEVVYAVLKDSDENELGVSAPITKKLNYTSYSTVSADSSFVNAAVTGSFKSSDNSSITAFPPSYDNMRTQMGSEIGFSSTSALPFWLSTLQPAGTTLGYANVIPLVYTKVGQAATIVSNILAAGIDFDTVPFDVDGYVWDQYVVPPPVTEAPTFQFVNGGFEDDVLVNVGRDVVKTSGWTIYKLETQLNSVTGILDYPTPTDPTPHPMGSGGMSPGEIVGGNSMSFSVSLASKTVNSKNVPPTTTSTRSLRMVSNGTTSTAYGIVRGPYAINNTTVALETGDTVSFWWKAEGGSDAYDIFAYLLNIDTGATILLLDETGSSTGAVTTWAQVTKVIESNQVGSYKFVFISGSFDYTGGRVLGASLYIDEVNVIKATTPTVVSDPVNTKYLKFTGSGQWPWHPGRGIQDQ